MQDHNDHNQATTKPDPRVLTNEELSQVSGGVSTWEACGAGAIAASWTGPFGSVLGCASGAASERIGNAVGVD